MIQLVTIGTSMITGRLLEAVADVDGVAFLGAYSRNPESAATYTADHGGTRSWSDLDAMLADPEVDVVYVASPNALHAGHARSALTAGKHVLLEKPVTTSLADWESLVELAHDQGVVLLEAMRSAYDPGMDAVRAVLPRLGTLRRVSLSYGQRSSRYDQVLAGERVNIFDPAMGGGAVMDLGVYCISAMVQLLGAPDRIMTAQVPLPTGVDGAGVAVATYPGLVADLSWSKITASSRPCEIQGELGTLTYSEVTSPRTLHVEFIDGSTEDHTVDAPAWNLRYEVERLIAAIDGTDVTADQHRTSVTMGIMDALKADPTLA